MAAGIEGEEAPWPVLFAPEERLGWSFRDRDRFRRAFGEPEPVSAGVPQRNGDRLAVLKGKLPRRLSWTPRAAAVGAMAGLTLLVRPKQIGSTSAKLSLKSVLIAGGSGAVVGAALWVALLLVQLALVRRHLAGREVARERRHDTAVQAWSERRVAFDEQEDRRLAGVPQWVPTPAPGHRRIDVVGGNLWGWEAFLTVFGSSAMMARGPMVVLDLSGERVVEELARGAVASGLAVDMQVLPAGLADSDLLVGLDVPSLVDIFIESLYAGDSQVGRGARVVDSRVLTALCRTLAEGGLTMPRIAAGARALLGEPASGEELSTAERLHLADNVFSENYRTQTSDSLRQIEALADALGGLGRRVEPRPAAGLRCVSLATSWRSGAGDFLADVLVAWAGRQVAGGADVATLVVVGADELAARHLERLSDLCNRRGTRLVVMFRHLREATFRMLGAGPVAFMNLGNPEEAGRAADFIGREHRFEISQLTQSVGGDQTHSRSDSTGGSRGSSQTAGRDQGLSSGGLAHKPTRTWGRSQSSTQSSDQNWGQSVTSSQGENWSRAESRQRVYEYAVEPRVLQQLPDYAMLLVEHAPTGVAVKAVEINPEIPLLQPDHGQAEYAASQLPDGFSRPVDGSAAEAVTGARRPGQITSSDSSPEASAARLRGRGRR